MLTTAPLSLRIQEVVVLYPYRWIVGVVSTVTIILWLTQQHISQANIALFYLLAVLLCAATASRLPTLLGATICFLAFKFFFVEPIFGFSLNDITKPWELLSFMVAALITGALTLHTREQAALVRQQADEIARLSRPVQPASLAQPAELTYFADGEFSIFLDDEDANLLLALFNRHCLVDNQNPAWELHDTLSVFVSQGLKRQAAAHKE